jgi:hypothetical protein
MSSISSKILDTVSAGNFGKQVWLSHFKLLDNGHQSKANIFINLERSTAREPKKALPGFCSIVFVAWRFECDGELEEIAKDLMGIVAEQEFA